MKPSEIHTILDNARIARKNGDNLYPLFVGPPGIAKSSVIQQWSKNNNLPFIDLRLAYLEQPDMIGYPDKQLVNGRQRLTYALPEFWPTEGEGVILLEEPNRGTSSMMNTIMQLLTDRKVHKYTLPDGWMIVGAINPENEHHDVNTMDAALKNRFVTYEVEYHKPDFISYVKAKKWNKKVVDFLETSTWTYLPPEMVSATDKGAKYVSPRTWEQVSAALNAGISEANELLFYTSILGWNIGKTFFAFWNEDTPIMYGDLLKGKKGWEALARHADKDNSKNGHLTVTIKSFLEEEKLEEKVVVQLLELFDANGQTDLSFSFMMNMLQQRPEFLQALIQNNPKLKRSFSDLLDKKV